MVCPLSKYVAFFKIGILFLICITWVICIRGKYVLYLFFGSEIHICIYIIHYTLYLCPHLYVVYIDLYLF